MKLKTKSERILLLIILVIVGVLMLGYLMFYSEWGQARMPRIGANSQVSLVTVPGTQTTWMDTGLDLKANKWYDVSGTGEVCFLTNYLTGECIPNAVSQYYGWCYPGSSYCEWRDYCSYFEADCATDPFHGQDTADYSHASVVVKLGEGECVAGAECYGSLGPSQPIGSIRTNTKKRVYVMINDHTGVGNTGSFTMEFERRN